ncbi:MAG: hypothetical protein AAF646_13695 [Pseudomonadota bacterium]
MASYLTGAALFASAAFLAACSSSSSSSGGQIDAGLTPEARLITLNEDGSIPDQQIVEGSTSGSFSRIRTINGRESGFAYQYGRVEGTDRFLGVAGIAPNTNPGPPPTEATASYTGVYALAYADRDGIEQRRGEITLEADFENGDLRGSAGGLAVDGEITGQIIDGTASYRNVDADMFGLIGSRRAVAAFAGDTGDALLVGGVDADVDE